MAEFEELRIVAKVDKESKADENVRQLQEALGRIADVQTAEQFQKLGRQYKLNEEQIKNMAEVVSKPNAQFESLIKTLGKGGAIFAAVEAVMAVHKAFLNTATKITDIAHAAEQLGVHPRQFEEDVRALERLGIDRGRAITGFLKFGEQRDNFMKQRNEFKDQLAKMFDPQFLPILRQHFRQLEEAPDMEAMLDRVLRFADQIEKHEVEHGKGRTLEERKLRGARMKREYIEAWTGIEDFTRIKNDFLRVTEEQKRAWDENQKAAEKYIAVTADIKNNIDDIIGSVMRATIEDLGLGEALQEIDFALKVLGEPIVGREEEARIKAIADKVEEENRRDWEARGILSIPARQWRILQAQIEIAKIELEGLNKLLHATRPPGWKPGMPLPGGRQDQPAGQPAKLFETFTENQSELILESKRLVENVAFLNALLSGESGMLGTDLSVSLKRRFGPGFHNRPRGGASGESNPEQVPATEPQPGGGAPAESRTITPTQVEFLKSHRAAVMSQLEDPASREKFMRLVEAETGSQGTRARTAFIQASIDRWAARGQTAAEGMASKAYFPTKTHTRADALTLSDARREEYETSLKGTAQGEAVFPGTTGNASDEPGNLVLTGHRKRGEVGGEERGEGFIYESNAKDVEFRKKLEARAYTGPEEGGGKGLKLDPETQVAQLQRGGRDRSDLFVPGAPSAADRPRLEMPAARPEPGFSPRTGEPIVPGEPFGAAELRRQAEKSGSAITQLGALHTGQRVYTMEQFATDPALQKQLGAVPEDIEEAKKQGLYGLTYPPRAATDVSTGVVFDPNVQSKGAGTLTHEAGHAGRALAEQEGRRDPNIFRRYAFQPGMLPREAEEQRQRTLDIQVARNLATEETIPRDEAKKRERMARGYLGEIGEEQQEGKLPFTSDIEIKRHEALTEFEAKRVLQREKPIDLPPMRAESRDDDAGRRALDRQLGDDLDVKGKLNVNVEAPGGTEVTAKGGGMFEGGVTLDRSLPAVM